MFASRNCFFYRKKKYLEITVHAISMCMQTPNCSGDMVTCRLRGHQCGLATPVSMGFSSRFEKLAWCYTHGTRVAQILHYNGVLNSYAIIMDINIVTWTVWFRNKAGNSETFINGRHATCFSTSSTGGKTSQKGQSALCKHCNLCSPNKHKVRHLSVFNTKTSTTHRKIHKHWNDVKTTLWGLTVLIFHCSK